MNNKEISNYLKCFADLYLFEKDRGRTTSFATAASKIDSFPTKISNDNLESLPIQGIGKSILKEIKLFLLNQPSDRLVALKKRWPSSSFKQLLELYNFDLQYVLYLWNTYRCDDLNSLSGISEPRVQLALSKIKTISTQAIDTKIQNSIYSLGDVTQTTEFYNLFGIDAITKAKAACGDKYLFAVDFLPSDNNFSDLESERLDAWFAEIKKAQLNHQIRIWSGAIVDIDLEGKPIIKNHNSKFDFYILHLSTFPHENKTERLLKGYNFFPDKERVVVSFIDKYTELNELCDILPKIRNIIIPGEIFNMCCNNATFAKNNLLLAGNLFNKQYSNRELLSFMSSLNISQTQIINSLPRPFKNSTVLNKAGVR